jgi:hypothetical protein
VVLLTANLVPTISFECSFCSLFARFDMVDAGDFTYCFHMESPIIPRFANTFIVALIPTNNTWFDEQLSFAGSSSNRGWYAFRFSLIAAIQIVQTHTTLDWM